VVRDRSTRQCSFPHSSNIHAQGVDICIIHDPGLTISLRFPVSDRMDEKKNCVLLGTVPIFHPFARKVSAYILARGADSPSG
jgi:hypothetical protein